MSIKAHSVFASDKLFPVYAQYAQQVSPQPAFITLDIRDGEIDADYSGEIGNGMPSTVWHDLVLRFPISPMSTTEEIRGLIEANMANFQNILDGAEEKWDGNNYVGRFTDEARELIEELGESLVQGTETSILTLAEFLQDCSIFPENGETLEAFAADIAGENGENGCYFYTDSATAPTEWVLDELMDLWAEHLYAGEDLPQTAAQALLGDGRCEDSAWMDELREFAGQVQ